MVSQSQEKLQPWISFFHCINNYLRGQAIGPRAVKIWTLIYLTPKPCAYTSTCERHHDNRHVLLGGFQVGFHLEVVQGSQAGKGWVEMVSVWRSGLIKTTLNLILYNSFHIKFKNKQTSKDFEVPRKTLGLLAEKLDSRTSSIINL